MSLSAGTRTLDYGWLLDRILATVEERAYLIPVTSAPVGSREALRRIAEALAAPDFEPEAVRTFIDDLAHEQQLDPVMRLSALCVVATHPSVANWALAARLAGEQEVVALQHGGADLSAWLASVDRHRGVIAWSLGQPAVALDHFSRALERQHNPENLGNVLCALVALGEHEHAADLFSRVSQCHPAGFVAELRLRVAQDPDLALLRDEEPS